MAKNSGNTRNQGANSKIKYLEYNKTTVNDVKNALKTYGKIDRWNNNAAYNMGFNDDALFVVEKVARADLGLATTIARQATGARSYDKYGVSLSDKQAWVIADAAVKAGMVPDKTIFRHYENQKEPHNTTSVGKQSLSSTKTKIGSIVTSKHGEGIINKIITKSSGYVEVKYTNGVIRKEMAFNLKGQDGKPLRNKPK